MYQTSSSICHQVHGYISCVVGVIIREELWTQTIQSCDMQIKVIFFRSSDKCQYHLNYVHDVYANWGFCDTCPKIKVFSLPYSVLLLLNFVRIYVLCSTSTVLHYYFSLRIYALRSIFFTGFFCMD